MTATNETFQEAWIADLKATPNVVSLLDASKQIKERQWQGDDFLYPAVRVSVEFMPSVNRCGPDDAIIHICSYSAEKSSKQVEHISAVIEQNYHGHPFTANGIRFSTVIVRKIHRPERTIFAWQSEMEIFCQGV